MLYPAIMLGEIVLKARSGGIVIMTPMIRCRIDRVTTDRGMVPLIEYDSHSHLGPFWVRKCGEIKVHVYNPHRRSMAVHVTCHVMVSRRVPPAVAPKAGAKKRARRARTNRGE